MKIGCEMIKCVIWKNVTKGCEIAKEKAESYFQTFSLY
jgi:hypothetical protein